MAHSLEAALDLARSRGETEAFNIGGATLYAPALLFADRIYLTVVHTKVDADTFFPIFDETAWQLTKQQFYPADNLNKYNFTFQVWERIPD